MKTYWITYASILLSYLIFSVVWIGVEHTMPPTPKVIYTCLAAMGLLIVAISTFGLKGLLLVPLSLFIWATVVDAGLGVYFHGNPFYLSSAWPDNKIIEVVQNGYLYTLFKGIGILVTQGLLRYLSANKF